MTDTRIGTTHCIECEAEAPLDSDGRCDFCSIESSEAEHYRNNLELAARESVRVMRIAARRLEDYADLLRVNHYDAERAIGVRNALLEKVRVAEAILEEAP